MAVGDSLGVNDRFHTEWPSAAAVGDAVIVRQDPSSASPFVVHGSHGAQLACATYAEAEARAASYAAPARANVWYVEGGRLQLVCSFVDAPAHLPKSAAAKPNAIEVKVGQPCR